MAVVLLACTCSRQADTPSVHDAFGRAQTAFRNARLNEAVEIAHVAAQRTAGDESARLRLLEAESLLAQGKLAEAEQVLQSISVRSDAITGRKQMLEAAVVSRRGDHRAASATLDEAFTLAERAGDADTQIQTLLIRALTSERSGDLAQGDSYLRRALEMAKRHDDVYHQAAALLNMALYSAKRHRWDEAAMRLQRVLALSAHRDDTAIIRSAALGNLSMCYARLGDLERAIEIRKQELAFHEQSGLRMYQAQSLGETGNLYLLAGKADEAAGWFRQAADVVQAHAPANEAADWFSGLAQALTASGRLDEAERALAQEKSLRRHGERSPTALTRARILARRGRAEEALALLEALLGDPDAEHLRWEVHAEIASLHDATGKPALAVRHFESALQQIDDNIAELARTDHRITLKSRLVRVHQQYVRTLIAQGQTERALEVVNATHARVLSAGMKSSPRVRADPHTLRRMATRAGATLLVYWLSPYGSGVWAITGSGVRYRSLSSEQNIRGLVRQHAADIEQRMSAPVQDTGSAAVRLYDELVRPVAPVSNKVLVVPDGPLHDINFETLVVREPVPHYWIEDVTISVAPSLSLLTQDENDRLSSRSRALLIGNPPQVDSTYPELRGSAAELNSVSQRFRNNVVHVRNSATPAAYKLAGPGQFSLIHFAAHAEANRASPLDSAIILFGERDQYKLYSRDVLEAPLNADLVVLSACRGAGARAYAGEGLVGFSWAFLRAGARNVVAGLWDVSDRSTATLMDRMYEEIALRQMDAAHALRAAKLSVLRSGGPDTRPWYWAPFQIHTRILR